ncbi:hypothetical protein MTR_5g039830 [Medicago truncatula]|uniref:Uncharacterized protein n=1 Tax=Medicago truncatula TaxID=3880 RepID=G7KDT8_MEDTR|nr:hypothetical protein MTR_5g039830 [Medicago truncatula]
MAEWSKAPDSSSGLRKRAWDEVYMEILPDPNITCGTNKVCLLKKDIYELK